MAARLMFADSVLTGAGMGEGRPRKKANRPLGQLAFLTRFAGESRQAEAFSFFAAFFLGFFVTVSEVPVNSITDSGAASPRRRSNLITRV